MSGESNQERVSGNCWCIDSMTFAVDWALTTNYLSVFTVSTGNYFALSVQILPTKQD